MHRPILVVALFVSMLSTTARPAAAQTIGVFRWQLLPHCNIVSLVITQTGTMFRLDGTDDQCGASTRASATGEAFVNPNGTIGFGFAVVTSPSAAPVHVTATITLPGLNGSWNDSVGNSGSFVLTPGAGIGGPPRPSATRELSVDVLRALLAGGGTTAFNGGCRAFGAGGSASLLLGLELPLGAVITQVRLKLVDESPDASMLALLISRDHPEGGPRTSAAGSEILASADSSAAIVPMTLTANAAVPVSDTRIYQVEVAGPAHTGTLAFCGLSVRYTQP